MSRCVEKPFAPLWAVWSYQGVSPRAPCRNRTVGTGVSGYGRAAFLSEQTDCRSPVTEMPLSRNWKSPLPGP